MEQVVLLLQRNFIPLRREPSGKRTVLFVSVDQRDGHPPGRQFRGDAGCGRRLAHTAFLIHHSDDFSGLHQGILRYLEHRRLGGDTAHSHLAFLKVQLTGVYRVNAPATVSLQRLPG